MSIEANSFNKYDSNSNNNSSFQIMSDVKNKINEIRKSKSEYQNNLDGLEDQINSKVLKNIVENKKDSSFFKYSNYNPEGLFDPKKEMNENRQNKKLNIVNKNTYIEEDKPFLLKKEKGKDTNSKVSFNFVDGYRTTTDNDKLDYEVLSKTNYHIKNTKSFLDHNPKLDEINKNENFLENKKNKKFNIDEIFNMNDDTNSKLNVSRGGFESRSESSNNFFKNKVKYEGSQTGIIVDSDLNVQLIRKNDKYRNNNLENITKEYLNRVKKHEKSFLNIRDTNTSTSRPKSKSAIRNDSKNSKNFNVNNCTNIIKHKKQPEIMNTINEFVNDNNGRRGNQNDQNPPKSMRDILNKMVSIPKQKYKTSGIESVIAENLDFVITSTKEEPKKEQYEIYSSNFIKPPVKQLIYDKSSKENLIYKKNDGLKEQTSVNLFKQTFECFKEKNKNKIADGILSYRNFIKK